MSKCEIASIGSLKGVETAFRSMKNADLTKAMVSCFYLANSYENSHARCVLFTSKILMRTLFFVKK